MSTKFDYLHWRGDLAFSKDGFNEVDGSILAMMSYVDFGAISKGKDILLRDASANYCPDHSYDSVKFGLIIPSKKINRLFCMAGETRRFSDVRVSDYAAKTSTAEMCQFAAVTFHIPGGLAVVAFRGTDDSLVGWREDCHLSFAEEIPSQRMALEYLEAIAAKYPKERLCLVGHSKGGNLSVYAAVRCSSSIKERIARAYSFDGPGFSKEFVNSRQYGEIKERLRLVVPQSSFVGTMFYAGTDYTVVNGLSRGALQHDSFTWEVRGRRFVHLPELSARGEKNAEQFRESMERMSEAEKKEFVEMLFSIVESTGAKTLTDFTDQRFKRAGVLIKNYNGLDKEKKTLMLGLVLKLFDFKRE